MSFPSRGMMAWYRNHIKDVAKFLDETHGIGRYKVYNLCSERTYDNEKFHNHVVHYPVLDHNVPTVKQMVDFVSEVDTPEIMKICNYSSRNFTWSYAFVHKIILLVIS